jgi:hypothetical protein
MVYAVFLFAAAWIWGRFSAASIRRVVVLLFLGATWPWLILMSGSLRHLIVLGQLPPIEGVVAISLGLLVPWLGTRAGRARRLAVVPLETECPRCRYSLRGLPASSPCPECGSHNSLPTTDKLEVRDDR